MTLDLVRRLVEGGDAAWAQFVADYRLVAMKAASTAARKFGATPTDVEDAVSELFVELLRDDKRVLRAYRGESAFTTWLTVVAYRVAVRQFARLARAPLPEASRTSAPDVDAGALAALSRLPDRERRALILFHVEDASYREIAEKLGIPSNQVGMVLLRAREALSRILRERRE